MGYKTVTAVCVIAEFFLSGLPISQMCPPSVRRCLNLVRLTDAAD